MSKDARESCCVVFYDSRFSGKTYRWGLPTRYPLWVSDVTAVVSAARITVSSTILPLMVATMLRLVALGDGSGVTMTLAFILLATVSFLCQLAPAGASWRGVIMLTVFQWGWRCDGAMRGQNSHIRTDINGARIRKPRGSKEIRAGAAAAGPPRDNQYRETPGCNLQ